MAVACRRIVSRGVTTPETETSLALGPRPHHALTSPSLLFRGCPPAVVTEHPARRGAHRLLDSSIWASMLRPRFNIPPLSRRLSFSPLSRRLSLAASLSPPLLLATHRPLTATCHTSSLLAPAWPAAIRCRPTINQHQLFIARCPPLANDVIVSRGQGRRFNQLGALMMDRAREAAHAATPNAVAFPLPPTGIVHISESTLTTFPRPCRPANQCLIGADVPSAPRQTVFFKARTFRFTVPTPSILLSYDNAPTLLSYDIASTLLSYDTASILLSYDIARWCYCGPPSVHSQRGSKPEDLPREGGSGACAAGNMTVLETSDFAKTWQEFQVEHAYTPRELAIGLERLKGVVPNAPWVAMITQVNLVAPSHGVFSLDETLQVAQPRTACSSIGLDACNESLLWA
ncbi:hypothetical protein PMIN01_04435 [Paraphaeosphaeria minitans]|uniref:Uncharacterized protein n=1 Tax=Paraphaeosphaeria minitans TaxID=565426 RepID=A0A9P6GJ87_9PLEO|nr:hypothetical protein PMIN01_04435 [Paraphaeosphaeria minitans]